jgi:hypothetical protein
MLCNVAAACLRTRYPLTSACSFTNALRALRAFFACNVCKEINFKVKNKDRINIGSSNPCCTCFAKISGPMH